MMKRLHSIKYTLLLYSLAIALIPLGLISYQGYQESVDSIRLIEKTKLDTTARTNVFYVQEWFNEIHRDLKSWSQLKRPRNSLIAIHRGWHRSGMDLPSYLKTPEYEEAAFEGRGTLERMQALYDYAYDLFMIDMNGNILFSVKHESDEGTNLLNGPYSASRFGAVVRQTLQDGKGHFSDLEAFSPSGGIITGFMSHPVVDDTGKMVGVMAIQIDLKTMFQSLKENQAGDATEHYLVGPEGLLRTDRGTKGKALKERINTEMFWHWYEEHGRVNLAGKPMNMPEEVQAYIGPDGNEVIGEHYGIDILGVRWGHISEIDTKVAYAASEKLAVKLLIALSISVIAIVLAALYLSRRISQPIIELKLASEAYQRGNKAVKINVQVENEIGELGQAFQEMIQTQSEDEQKLKELAEEAHQALRALKEQKLALDTHSIVAITDVKGTITYVNGKFEEISGYSKDELIGNNHRILNSHVHAKEFWKEMYHTVSHGGIWHDEVCNKAKDGHLYWVDTTIIPFYGEFDTPQSYVAVRTDITARKNAEFVLAEKEGSLQTLLDSVAEGIYGVDVNGFCTFANRSFLRLLRYEHESDVIGKHIHELIHYAHEDGTPYPSDQCKMYRANQTHQPSHVDDEVFWRSDGTAMAVEYWSYPMLRDGEFIGAVATFLDISERKAAEKAMRTAMSLQKAVFDSAAVSIITTNTTGVITAMNSAAETMLEYSCEEMVNVQTPAIIHKLDEVVARAAEFSEELGMTVEPGFDVFVIKSKLGLPNAYEWTYVSKTGRELPVYLSVTALRESSGEIYGYMGIATNISKIKEAEAEMIHAKEVAEASARTKSEFLAAMSHEIRTPMNGVLGMLGLLEHTKLDESQRHQVRIASRSANSLLGLINDILDFSKVEAGKMTLEMIEFNLMDELGEFVESIAFRTQEKNIELILDTTRLCTNSIISDPGRLRQILTNLVGNAVKFTHRGHILIRAEIEKVNETEGRLHIDVSDSGIGIPAEKLDTLFDSFTQADSSTTRKYGGTGLGLAIVKKLCQLMGGDISVSSVEYEGSTFSVDVAIGLGSVSKIAIPSVSVEGKSVLIIDDNEINRAVVKAQLEQWGMEVYEADDPIIAFDNCQIRISQGFVPPYDVALVDMQMPNMDGSDLGAEIRQIRECDEMKMVMMTSLGSRNDAARFAQIGFDAFFAKPTTMRDLLNALRVLFDEGEALRAAKPLVTKDYLGTLSMESEKPQWPESVRILLVEDNPTNQIVAQGMLDIIGLHADIANNGLEALESMELAMEIAPYTLVLMDCQMPEMDGYAASSAIREGRAGEMYKTVPIIAMTANAMAGDREKCIVSGMSDYITKPINVETLKKTLMQWLIGEEVLGEAPKLRETKPQEEELKVWDKADALARLGNSEALLKKIVQSFVTDAPKILEALAKAVQMNDAPSVQLHAHSMKGSAGNVSAQKVQSIAKTIEFAAKEGDEKGFSAPMKGLEKALNEALELLYTFLNSEDKKPVKIKREFDPVSMTETLGTLKNDLEAGSFVETDNMPLFDTYAEDEMSERLDALKKAIDNFDTANALAIINIILRGLE